MKAESVLMRWARLGAAFNIAAVESTPDIERLLIDTAEALPDNARLFAVVVSWLCRNYRLVCKHRLAVFAGQIDDRQVLAGLGLMLDIVKTRLDIDHFNIVIKKCKPLKELMPLFAIDRKSKSLTAIAKLSSCPEGVKWGLWCQDVQLKDEAIRPLEWIMAANQQLNSRAVFNGNLRASILETLTFDRQACESESALARYCGVTRKAVREALDHLEFCQMIRRVNMSRRVGIMR